MADRFQARHTERELTVVFADLNLERPQEASPIGNHILMQWPQQVFDAAVDYRLLLNREFIDLLQRNLNASFSFLRRLTEAKNFGEVLALHAMHLSNQVTASMGQSEELATLSIKTAMGFIRDVYPGQTK